MRRAWSVPLALLALLVAEAALVPALVRPEVGSLYELHVRANRGAAPRACDEEDVARLLASPDPVRRDYAMTWDLTRRAGSERQRAWLEALEQRSGASPEAAADAAIGRFFLRHQVRSPDLESVRAYLAALAQRRARLRD